MGCYEEFAADIDPKKEKKTYKNVKNLPLLLGTIEELKDCHLPIFHFLPPAELHLLLGVVNHLFDEMCKCADGKWKSVVFEWANKSLCKRKNYQGGKFEGNQCRKLLANLSF